MLEQESERALRLREFVRVDTSHGEQRKKTALGGAPDSAIAPLVIGDDRRVMQLSAHLFERRVFVQGIRHPTVPEGTARLRISVAVGHRMEDLETAALAINDAMSHTT